MKYVIRREDRPEMMLSGVGIGSSLNPMMLQATNWTVSKSMALQFEEGEAEATIEFLTNVIDWELGEQLYSEAVD